MNKSTKVSNDQSSAWVTAGSQIPWGRNALKKPDLLANAKSHLYHNLHELSWYKRYRITQEVKRLEHALKNKPANVATPVSQFTSHCDDILQNKHSNTKRAVYTFAASIIVTALATLIGFGIGFATGCWTGPGAFITGFIAGGKAACATAAFTGLMGITAGHSAFQFFSKNKEVKGTTMELAPKEVIDNFADQVTRIAGNPA